MACRTGAGVPAWGSNRHGGPRWSLCVVRCCARRQTQVPIPDFAGEIGETYKG